MLKSMIVNGLLICGPCQYRFALFLVVAAIVGCAETSGRQKTVPVSGTVKFEGKAIPSGSLLFVPINPGPSAQANLRPDGTFKAGTYEEADGMIPGEYRIAISGQMTVEDSKARQPDPHEVSSKKFQKSDEIPERYSDLHKSGLTANIRIGEKNELTFELKQ